MPCDLLILGGQDQLMGATFQILTYYLITLYLLSCNVWHTLYL